MPSSSRLLLGTLAVALLVAGCGGDSERDTPTCRNAWRQVQVPPEFSDFRAGHGYWHDGTLYLFKALQLDAADHFPAAPAGLAFQPPNRFSAISSEGAPDLRGLSLIFPVGDELLLYGVSLGIEGWVSRYDTTADRWLDAQTSEAPVASLYETAIPMGDELLRAIMREYGDPLSVEYYAYGPQSGWRSLEPPGSPALWLRGIWSGREVILWERFPENTAATPAVAYEPASETWRTVSTLGAPALTPSSTGIWTGTELIVGEGLYYPDSDAWEIMSLDGAAAGSPIAASDRRMVVWLMGWPDPTDAGGAVYDAKTDSWGPPITTRCLGQPVNVWDHAWIDDGLLIWLWRGWEEPQDFRFLPAEAVFGEAPADAADCSCPGPLGEE